MILYYSPGACSQAPHIILNEAGVRHQAIRVDIKAHKLEDGTDYYTVNPKGAVPALRLDNGELLTENAVILQYIAELVGNEQLLPRAGELSRYRVLEWLNFITTELHKSFAPLFRGASEEIQAYFRDLIGKRLGYVEEQLGSNNYLTGETLTVADAYLFVVIGWAGRMGFDMSAWPRLTAFRDRMAQRPAVRRTLEQEGLLKKELAG
jgi:glutathione S-transferase